MRTSLSKHLNEFVLCRGWIGVWEDFSYSKTRRITVNQPTITKPNKRLLFKDQEVISTENHLNLFVKFEDLINYNTKFFELRNTIHFSGVENIMKERTVVMILGYMRLNNLLFLWR